MSDSSIQQQIAYYRARAGEYDQWFFRQGRYDRGPELNARWFAEVEEIVSALDRFHPSGNILELACGTGLWTSRLEPHAKTMVAVDASPEVLAINRERVHSPKVTYVEADLFAWEPTHSEFDVAFFSFWLSHVPPAQFAAFWEKVGRILRPGGRVFFVDSLPAGSSSAIDHQLPDPNSIVQKRKLNDGREYDVYKIFYVPAELKKTLRQLGWIIEVKQTASYFLYGSGQRT